MTIRVLLVDDVADVRRMVRTALRLRGGFEVVAEAGDGGEAVRRAETEQPDLVVLDLGLPDLAGREVLTGIRSGSPKSKVVVFSGTETVDRAEISRSVEGYVLKDEDLGYLLDLLESVTRPSVTEVELELPRDPTSARAARTFVSQTIRGWRLDHLLDDALLVASELATNAMTPAESSCRIRLRLNAASLRIDVVDGGSGTPEPQPESATEEGGRGLRLVAALTSAWGLEALPDDGKLVWAELARAT
jgi:CheY-like chemotaxis protein